ncbi:glutathione peroxidase [Algicola sagamiensis]|uniref:glutathione peroxidase n=1 Tax=Algicola sagamiensis TaxID=163869 RepID=UPI00038079A6|nr:glutathione peroxidase [Algicola sagamiensis]
MENVYDFRCMLNNGEEITLSDYEGKVLLIVNTASQCGFTPQYKGLEELYEKYKEQGLVILGFPCNQFGQQEPGDDAQIEQFCSVNFGVTFPLFRKVDVNGPDASPLYEYLKDQARGVMRTRAIKWNFTKFLIGKDGQVLKRFSPRTTPKSIDGAVQEALSA